MEPDRVGTGSGSRRTGRIVVLLGSILIFFTACTGGEIRPSHLEPASGGRSAFFFQGGLVVSARYLEREERARILSASGRESLSAVMNGFPAVSFLLEVDNRSGSEVVFDPSDSRFVTGRGPAVSPLDYAVLSAALPEGRMDPPVMREYRDVAFDRPVVIPDGGSMERMMFFQAPEKAGKEAAVILEGLYVGGAHLRAALAFRAVFTQESSEGP